jgi:hypothetical protein
MTVAYGHAQIFVAEQRLHGTQVGPSHSEMTSEAVPEIFALLIARRNARVTIFGFTPGNKRSESTSVLS